MEKEIRERRQKAEAAALDMLAALKVVVEHYPNVCRLSYDEEVLLEIVEAAISKAEGKQL